MNDQKLLSQEFLNQYPSHPEHMSPLGLFTFYRTYSRFLPEEKRRETWKETVARAVEYNVGLQAIHEIKNNLPVRVEWLREEAQKLFDSIFNLKQFPSGRTLFIGGTKVSRDFPMANFNCSFTNISKWSDLRELFYLLMLGSGVGLKATKETLKDMPPIRTQTTLILSPYKPVPEDYRLEHTDTRFLENGFAKIYVGDSKEGWCDALAWYFRLLSEPQYEHVHTIKISFNSVRPKGERLKTFGGTASGPEPLSEMFQGIDDVFKNKVDSSLAPIEVDEKGYGRVRPIHILDIANFIGSNVVVGGVRRTAEIFLFDADDYECLFAKYNINGFWTEDHLAQDQKVKAAMTELNIPIPAWMNDIKIGVPARNINHRRMSNNSIVFTEKPSEDFLHLVFQLIQLDAEPGFVNLEEMSRRRENAQGVNPCGEILLDSKQQCNLTTVNVKAFLRENGKLDLGALAEAQELSARAGVRMALVDLELPEWDRIHKRDRLAGCSLTGTQEAFSHYSKEEQKDILQLLNDVANGAAEQYAYELRIPIPLLVTTVKPEGTLSLVAGGVSPGLHDAHAPYFIRRIRVSVNDAMAKAALAHGWNIHPEVGTPENKMENARIIVIDFPVKSEAVRTKDDVGAMEQLERYFVFQDVYTNHNSSNTITVRPEEWLPLEKEIYRKWDDFVGVSFLSHDGGTYQLAPYEAITKEQYEELASQYVPFDPDILQLYETVGASELDADDPDCATGACPVR